MIPFNGRSALDELEASDDHRRLRDAMKTLDPMKRKLVIAAYINGESREQLSAALRRAGEHDQDLAAPRRARHPRRASRPTANSASRKRVARGAAATYLDAAWPRPRLRPASR